GRERSVAQARSRPDRSGHRRALGARDRAGGDGRDPGRTRRRHRPADEHEAPARQRTRLGPIGLGPQLQIMKAIAQRRDGGTLEGLVGKVVCHDVRDAAAKIAVEKGARLTESTAKILLATPWDEIHLIAVDPTDLHEEEAGKRLAAAVVGDGVEVKGYTGGQWTLAATRRGLLEGRRQALADANAGEGTSTCALCGSERAGAGERVGKGKVTPLVTPAGTLAAVEKIARDARGLVAVSAFRPATIGVVAQERLDGKQRARFEAALKLK